ncbi:MAG: acetate--CoA ligase family protein [Pseudomonadota bacterium]
MCPREATAPRVALAAEDERIAGEVARVAEARGFPLLRLGLEAAVDAPVGAIAFVPARPPEPRTALKIAKLCRRAAENRRPVVLLAAFERARGRIADERAAALAYLRTNGAIIAEDPDVWFETAALIAAFGAPPGPRVAIIAPPGCWLSLQASVLAQDYESRCSARMPVTTDLASAPAVDAILVDRDTMASVQQDRIPRTLIVPVVARAEALLDGPSLVDLRATLAAVALAGRHAERLASGFGPIPPTGHRKLKVDRERVEKALAGASDHLGDHETKLLLSAYGTPVTRQGVATTPSAAVRIAKTCGWPVQVRPWDPAIQPERNGEPLIVGVKNPPDVRRAFASAATAAGLKVGSAVIVRVTPPPGREIGARIEKVPEIGWTVIVEVPGAARPLAAPAPLRRIDAEELASGLESTRSDDAPVDRQALADLLARASFAVVDREQDIEELVLSRILVAEKGHGAVVVDARTRLRKDRPRREVPGFGATRAS